MTAAVARRRPRLSRALAAASIALTVLLVAVWVTPRASGAAAAWLRAPSVSLKTLTVPGGSLAVAGPQGRGAGAPVTLDAGTRFSMVAIVCDVPSPGAVTVHVRTGEDGRAWGPWLPVPLEVVDENGSAQAFTEPVWTGTGRYVQVRADRNSARGPAGLTGVRLVAIDPTGESGVAARVTGVARHVAAAVAGVTLTDTAAAAAASPTIVTRADWGADESLRSGSPSYAPVKVAFVHHTASGNVYSQADAPGIVRAIYAYHTKSLHWSDIGYNFLIDRYGTIYEGRYGGVASGVVGAQAGGFNTGSTGVSVLGTFLDQAPPAATVTALERLLAWKLGVAGLDPLGSSTLTCGLTDKHVKGATVAFPVIAGHRQANYTECPGDAFYALLPAIRADVARRVGTAVAARLTATRPLISPNGDGVLDATELQGAITAAADWRLTVKDSDGRTVAAWSGQGTTVAVTWKGTSDGSYVPDGVYTAELTATPSAGDPVSATTSITVDTEAPRLARADASPASFSPNGDGQAETVSVSYGPSEACAVRVGILDADGDVVRWLHGWRTREAREYSLTWDGRVSSGGGLVVAPDGDYRFDVERRDAAGNIGRRGVPITLDRTLGHPAATPVTISPDGDGVRDAAVLGFTLTRRAAVTVRILVDGDVVRTLALGDLGAGTRTATWDGRTGSGEYLASSRPTFAITAVSAIGASSAGKGLVVDLYRPKLYATSAKATTAGTATKLGFKAVDPFSAKVDVSYVVTDSKGRRVASGHPGWVLTGQPLSATWRPASRGVFTVIYRAVDRGGNHEANAAQTTVTVR